MGCGLIGSSKIHRFSGPFCGSLGPFTNIGPIEPETNILISCEPQIGAGHNQQKRDP